MVWVEVIAGVNELEFELKGVPVIVPAYHSNVETVPPTTLKVFPTPFWGIVSNVEVICSCVGAVTVYLIAFVYFFTPNGLTFVPGSSTSALCSSMRLVHGHH